MNEAPAVRLYGSSIAIVSGLYSIASSAAAAMSAGMPGRMMNDMPTGFGLAGLIMLALGVIVLLHGIVLLTPASARLTAVSGPLMIVWAVAMLANQLLGVLMPLYGMQPAAMDGSRQGILGLGLDEGMVALAVLMLISGAIMSGRRGHGAGTEM